VFGPATFWIAASLTLWALGLAALVRLARRNPRPTDPPVATLALLHAAFVFKFYGWEGSWTYYSYLPVLGILVGLSGRGIGVLADDPARPRRPWLLYTLITLGGLGLVGRYEEAFSRWMGMSRSPDTAGLWAYQDERHESRQVRAMAAAHHTLFLVNGTLTTLWPEVQTPPVWFLSPGVLLDQEFETVRQKMRAADMIVLYAQYDPKQEAWTWDEFAKERALFEENPVWSGHYYRVYQRKAQNSNPP